MWAMAWHDTLSPEGVTINAEPGPGEGTSTERAAARGPSRRSFFKRLGASAVGVSALVFGRATPALAL